MTLNINSEPCPLHRIMFDPVIDGGCPLCQAEAGTPDGQPRLILANPYYRMTQTVRFTVSKWTQDYLSHLTHLRY